MRAHGTRSRSSDERDTTRQVAAPSAPVQRMLTLQRLAGNAAVARSVEAERHEHGPGCGHANTAVGQEPVQRRMAVPEETLLPPGQETIDEAIASPAKPLDSRIRAKVEQHYPMSFGHLLVHNNPVAQRSAARFGARAYTTGSHIVSGEPNLDDETLLHEVDHAFQQATGQVAGTNNGAGVNVSSEHDAFEVSAAKNGKRMAQGLAPDLSPPGGGGGAGGGVQRAPAAAPETQAGPVQITHPQIKLLTPRPDRLYRGDSRAPDQVMGDGGFTSQGMNYDKLIKHLLGRIRDEDESGWISTSSDQEIAKTFASPPSRSDFNPGQPASLFPPRREVKPTRVSTGWVYEIKPTGNVVAFDDHAEKETETRQTKWTKEWGAIRKIHAVNIERAVKYKATYQSDKNGAPSNRLSIEALETWENPHFDADDHGYNPYADPNSGWSDQKDVIDRVNIR